MPIQHSNIVQSFVSLVFEDQPWYPGTVLYRKLTSISQFLITEFYPYQMLSYKKVPATIQTASLTASPPTLLADILIRTNWGGGQPYQIWKNASTVRIVRNVLRLLKRGMICITGMVTGTVAPRYNGNSYKGTSLLRMNPLGIYTPAPIQTDLVIRNFLNFLPKPRYNERKILNSWRSL